MGKWNYRRRWTPKNYYRDQRIPSPPTYYDTEFKLRGAWRNPDLPWEERFCISVGIPWEKVLDAKNYMNSYDNVLNWNDSAGELNFSEAKKRFWDKINEIPTDDPKPDPNMYNEDIDWNPEIDLELVKDLDRAYFNPDDPQFDTSNGVTRKNDGLVPGCILGLDEINKVSENPWESIKNGWNCSNKSLNKNKDPWKREIVQDGGWGGGNSWHNDHMRGGGANKSWERVDNDNSRNAWGNNGNSQRYDSYNVGTSRGNYRGGFGRGRHEGANNVNHQNWESKDGCRKREGSQQYNGSSYKSARFQYDDDYKARGGSRYRRW